MKRQAFTFTRRLALGHIGAASGATALSAALTGCATTQAPATTKSSDLSGTFAFTVQNFQPTINIIERAIPAFQQKFPGAKITYTPVAFGDMATKTRSEVAAGSGPDGFHTYTGFWRGTDAANVMLPLTPMLFKKTEVEQITFPNVLVNAVYSKKPEYFVMPFSVGVNGSMFLYNSNLLGNANVDPKTFKTLDDFVEAAKKLTDRQGGAIVRAGVQPTSHTNLIMRWIIDQGGRFYDEKTYKWTWQTAEAEKAFQWILDLYDKHDVAWKQTPPGIKDALGEQRAAARIDGAFAISGYATSYPDLQLADVPLPAFVAGKTPNYYEHEYSGYALSALLKPDDMRAKIGAAFYKELLSADSLIARANEYSGAILVKSVYTDPRFKDTKFGPIRAKLPEQVISKMLFMSMAANPGGFQAQVDKVITGQTSIKSALSDMQQQYTNDEEQARRNMG